MSIQRRWPVTLALAGFMAGLLTGCQAVLVDSAPRLVVGMTDRILATDPASGYDPGSWMLFNNVFQSLLRFPEGSAEPQPDAAKSCGFTDAGAKVFRCVLRDDLEFSNGDPLTVEDVEFSFERMLRINDPAGPAIMLRTLESVSTPDDRTVIFRLNEPDATFPSKIASGAGSIVDHRQYEADRLRTDRRAVGSGPYRLDSFDEHKAVFSVNESFKGAAETKNSGVTLRFFHANQDALKRALTSGEVDMAYRGLSLSNISEMTNDGDRNGLDVIEGSSAEVQHLVFNMKDPVAGNLGVRRAFAYLLDRDSLVRKVFQDTAIPLYSIVPAGISGHTTAFFDTYGARPSRQRATEALRAEGITDKVKITLWSTPTRYGPATDHALKLIAEQLEASGLFEAQVRSVPFDEYEKAISAGKYGVYVKGWVPDYPDADNFTAPFFGDGNVLNNNYSNSRITKELLPRTAAESDRTNTRKEFGKIQDIVAAELPVLPLWQGKQYAVVRSNVRGYQYCLDASTVFRFWALSKA